MSITTGNSQGREGVMVDRTSIISLRELLFSTAASSHSETQLAEHISASKS